MYAQVQVFKVPSSKRGAEESVQKWQVSDLISEDVDENVSHKLVRQSGASHSAPLLFASYRNTVGS